MLRRVQRRRWLPTALVQAVQRIAHAGVLHRALEGGKAAPPAAGAVGIGDEGTPATDLPLPLRLVQRVPALQAVPARLIAIGPLPEHAPEWARRAPAPVAAPAPR